MLRGGWLRFILVLAAMVVEVDVVEKAEDEVNDDDEIRRGMTNDDRIVAVW